MRPYSLVVVLLASANVVVAQFGGGFFDHLFGGQQQGQHPEAPKGAAGFAHRWAEGMQPDEMIVRTQDVVQQSLPCRGLL